MSDRYAQARIREHFEQHINTASTDILLYFCWFTTGILDSTIFNGTISYSSSMVNADSCSLNIAYRIFLLMQTGNLVFMGLDTAHDIGSGQHYGWVKSLCSFVSFLVGCVFFSKLGTLLKSPTHPRRRLTLFLSFVVQTFILFLCAILVQTRVFNPEIVNRDDTRYDWLDLIPIILLTFQGPGQILAGRQLGLTEMPTVVASIMMFDFAYDPDLLVKKNVRRTRRIVGVVACFLVRTPHLNSLLSSHNKHHGFQWEHDCLNPPNETLLKFP